MAGSPSGRDQKIFILTGNIESGKSSFLIDIVEILGNRNYRIAGFIAPSFIDDDASRSYKFRDLSSVETIPLASRIASKGWLKMGNFYFNPEALRLGNRILMDPDICKNDLVIVDEIGPFELEGKIWADTLTHLRNSCACYMIWTVRKQLLDMVIKKWQLIDPVIIDLEHHSLDQAAGMILTERIRS